MYVRDDTPTAEIRYRCRFYIDPNSITMGNNENIDMMLGAANEPFRAFAVRLKYLTASGYNIGSWIRSDDLTYNYLSNYPITDGQHCIEVDFIKSSGANDGSLQLIIDGVSKETKGSIDNDRGVIDYVQIGIVTGTAIGGGTSGTFFLDDFASNNDGSEIGLISEGATQNLTGTSACVTSSVSTTINAIISLAGTSVCTIATSSELNLAYIMAGTSAAYVEAVAGFLENIYVLVGTSASAISTIGVINNYLSLSGTSVNKISASLTEQGWTGLGDMTWLELAETTWAELGETVWEAALDVTYHFSGTAVCALNTTVASNLLNETLKLYGTSANVVSAIGDTITLGTITKLSGTSASSTSTSGELSIGIAGKISGTAAVSISTIADTVGNTYSLLGTSACSLTTSGSLNITFSIYGTSVNVVSTIASTLTFGLETKISGTSSTTVITNKLNAIDIGVAALEYDNNSPTAYTQINTGNPSNAKGMITSVEIYVVSELDEDINDVVVATFYRPDATNYPNNFTVRDSEEIGTLPSSEKSTVDVTLLVEIGDYLGVYYTNVNASIPYDIGVSLSGIWSISGDYTAANNNTFTFYDDVCLALYATGETATDLTLGTTEKLSGTSINIISTIGALRTGVISKFSGTSVNAISTSAELTIGIVTKFSGTSVNVVTTSSSISGAAIDIGSEATNRDYDNGQYSYTLINKGNPANEDGKITNVEMWVDTSLVNCEVATFYLVSGSNYSTRDTQFIGDVTAGSKQTFEVDLDVQAGDILGLYLGSANSVISMSLTGGLGVLQKLGDNVPCTNQTFALIDDNEEYAISLYGSGAGTEVGGLTLGTTERLSGTSVCSSTTSGIFSGVSSLAGTSANTISTLALELDTFPITRISGTSASKVSAVGAINEIYILQGTSVNVISTVGELAEVGVTLKLSGTSESSLTTSGAIQLVLGIKGTSVNAVSTVGFFAETLDLSGTSVCTTDTLGALTIGLVTKLSGTATSAISTVGVLTLGIVGKIAGTSVNVVSTSGGLSLGEPVTLSGTAVVTTTTSGVFRFVISIWGTSETTVSTLAKIFVPKWESSSDSSSTWTAVDKATDTWQPEYDSADIWTPIGRVSSE